jgi:hypothetical protein
MSRALGWRNGPLALFLTPSPLCLSPFRIGFGRGFMLLWRHADHNGHDLGRDVGAVRLFAHSPIFSTRDGPLQPSRAANSDPTLLAYRLSVPICAFSGCICRKSAVVTVCSRSDISLKASVRREWFMAGELIAGLSIFKSLYDSAKALKDINDATIRNGAIIELQEKILAAREAQTALLERISELEKEVASFKTWEDEKKKYEMKVIGPGSIVYALKSHIHGAEEPHYICANCYEDGKKSPLQRNPANPIGAQHFGERDTYRCFRCHLSVSY